MFTMMTRRRLIAGIAVGVSIGPVSSQANESDAVASIERRHGGRLGVFVLDTGSGRTLAHRADERFLMCSTFKGVLAALILSRIDAGRDRSDDLVPYGKQDLLGHSPVTAEHVDKGALPIGMLCEAIVLYSDNGAANLLLRHVGGPAALTAYVRRLGDSVTRFDRYELAASDRSGLLDTTTPCAISQLVRILLLHDALSQNSRERLERLMMKCETGADRLRASFPKTWIVGDKTGTGDGNCNDYAIVRRHGWAPIVMAAYYDAPGMKLLAQEAALREVGAAIVRWTEDAS